MKKITLLFLFLGFSLFAQEKVEFIYKVTGVGSIVDSTDTNYEAIKPYIEKMVKELDDLTYSLRVNTNESLWYLVDSKSYSSAHMGKALGGNHTYYFDFKTKQYLEQRVFLENYFLIETPQKEFHWELIDETREILGYTCKKAISKEVKNSNGKDTTFITEAWYCPTLNYPIGPLNFGGLNGLILELTDKKRKFYCTEIRNSDKLPMFILTKPNQGKIVSEEEFLKEMERLSIENGIPFFKG